MMEKEEWDMDNDDPCYDCPYFMCCGTSGTNGPICEEEPDYMWIEESYSED